MTLRALLLVPALGATLVAAEVPSFRTPIFFEARSAGEFASRDVRLSAAGFHAGGATVRFAGARVSSPSGESPLQATVTRFSAGRRTSVPAFKKVRYSGLYPGIDAVFHGERGEAEFDLHVAPGANPSRIRLKVDGGSLSLDNGDLIVTTGAGKLRLRKPDVFQGTARIDGAFEILDSKTIRFRLGQYDPSRELLIDPAVVFSTYAGGSSNDWARAIGTDAAGNVYIAGSTTSGDLPVSTNAPQTSYRGHTTSLSSGDAFVAKFSPTGTLIYFTYLGGTGDDYALGMAVDGEGNAYVTGVTNSTEFPVTASAYQRTFGGRGGNEWSKQGDAFVTKINPSGTQLIYSTFLGGSQDETGMGIAVDAAGNAYVTGTSLSANYPVSAGAYQNAFRGRGGQSIFPRFGTSMFNGGDAFVTKLNAAGSNILFSTFVGGRGDDVALSIAIDSAGNSYVGGYTLSTDFPVTAGAPQSAFRGTEDENFFFNFGDGFLFKLNATGTAIVYSTFLGGTGDDAVACVRVDAGGNLVASGTSTSRNLPTTAGAYQRAYAGPTFLPFEIDQLFGDAFVVKLNPSGGIMFLTYLGGEGDDTGAGCALDNVGNVIVHGRTVSTRFPVTSDALQRAFAGTGGQTFAQPFGDLFLAQLSADGSKLIYSTYYGGQQDESSGAVTIDAQGNVVITGNTLSRAFPTSPGAHRSAFIGIDIARSMRGDAYVAKFSGFATAAGVVPTLAAVANAASNAAGIVSPGMIFVAYGKTIGPAALVRAGLNTQGRLSSFESGTRFRFDGVESPLVYVSDTQSAGIVPYSVAGKTTVQMVVEKDGQSSAPLTVRVQDAVPGLFSSDFSGSGQGAIFNQDGTPNSAANPADPESIVVLYGTGEGTTIPTGADGKVATEEPFPKPAAIVTANIGGSPARVEYAGAVPFQVAGLLQVNVRLPAGIGSGNKLVIVTFGFFRTQANLTVAVK